MKVFSKIGILLLLGFLSTSCNNDDNGIQVIPANDPTEQSQTDDLVIQEYLKTHFFNYEDFENGGDLNQLVYFGEIEGDNSNKIPLSDQVVTKKISYLDVEYNIYYFLINEGANESPNFSDRVYVEYQGFTFDNNEFDSRKVSPVWFDLLNLVDGWRFVLPEFKTGNFTENADGTINFSDFGKGFMIIPSGLGYFNAVTVGDAYSPLIFTIDLFSTEVLDHDGDLVPTYIEDLDGDFDLTNDDTDEDFFPNYLDNDDDGDTRLSNDEDYDGDGDPTNDDKNGNDIPDYLDYLVNE